MKKRKIAVWKRRGYVVSDDPARLDMDFLHGELNRTYWSPGVPRKIVERAAANSLVFGVYRADGAQVGFARLVTDKATFAYLADVIVAESERGRGLGKWLIECVVAHPEVQDLRRWMLATRDAHALYRKTGWKPLAAPERFMERHFPDVYRAGRGSRR